MALKTVGFKFIPIPFIPVMHYTNEQNFNYYLNLNDLTNRTRTLHTRIVEQRANLLSPKFRKFREKTNFIKQNFQFFALAASYRRRWRIFSQFR